MKTYAYSLVTFGSGQIRIGRQGENLATRIDVDVAPWKTEYPTGTVSLFVVPPVGNGYLAALEENGNTISWVIRDTDTAYDGHGKAELILTDARGTVMKSVTAYTICEKSPSAAEPADPPEAIRPWVEQILEAIKSGDVSAEAIAAAVEAYLQEHGVQVEETDPTVPSWAKQPSKPTYTASEVGALPISYTPPVTSVNGKTGAVVLSAQDVGARPDTWMPSASEVGADAAGTASGAVSTHNVSGASHADLRALIEGLTSRLNALADSDDTTLDQLSEIVAYIKSNKALIDAVTTGKVSTSDIVDNLTTNASSKVLSAAQGVALKGLIDAIVIPDKLPNPQPLTINGQSYDGSAAVEVSVTGEGSGVEVDATLTQSGKAADAKAVGDRLTALNEANEKQDTRLTALEQTGGIVMVEPAQDDVPIVFFGGDLPQTKTDTVMPFKYVSKTKTVSGYVETKAQGNSSMSYPKKNQTVKMYADEALVDSVKVDFKGWGAQKKHVYKANWIDLTHSRNVVSAQLWGDVVKSRANYLDLPELLRTSPNQGAIDGFPVLVYAGGVYQGRYTINIPKDAWMANMDKTLDNHCILCGENYVSGCFRAAANINGSDWSDEVHDTVPSAIKTRWNEIISFVMNSTDDEFVSNIGNYFYLDSLIDYYIFGVVSCGLDAFGKNQLYQTYDGQKWIATMYDMDSTWGLWWNGGSFVATDYARTEFQDFKDGEGNLLYIRLEELFYDQIQARWAELKDSVLSYANIMTRFERFIEIVPPHIVKEDYASTTGGGKFTGIPSQNTNHIQQIRSYVAERLPYADEWFASLTPVEEIPCTGITLDQTELTFSASGTQTLTATVTPSDTTDTVSWSSNNNEVATVSGGVVTALGNGDATITATCGAYSATCAVSVSGIETGENESGIVWSDTPSYQTQNGIAVSGNNYISEPIDIDPGIYELSNADGATYNWARVNLYNGSNYVGKQDQDAFATNALTLEVFEHPVSRTYRFEVSPITDPENNNNPSQQIKFEKVYEGMWSPSASYNVSASGVSSGDGYVTMKNIPVSAGTLTFSNVGDATFIWKEVYLYDSAGAQISKTGDGGKTTATVVTIPENAVYAVLKAYPNKVESNNDPSTQLTYEITS